MKVLFLLFILIIQFPLYSQTDEKISVELDSSYNDPFAVTDSLRAYYSWGWQNMGLRDYSTAIKYFDKYISDNSGKERYQLCEAIIKRAICKRELLNNIGALQDLDYALSLYPNTREVYFERGNTKDDLGDRLGAINDFSQALKCKEDGKIKNDEIHCNLAISYAYQEKNDLAMNSINEAIRLSPNQGWYYTVRGEIYWVMEKDELACKDYSRAGELGYYDAYKKIQEKCK